MKSKLNTILQLVIIVLLAVVIALQIFNISNKDADSILLKKTYHSKSNGMITKKKLVKRILL